MKSALGLVEYAAALVGKPYWMGTFGQLGKKWLWDQCKDRLPAYYKDRTYDPSWENIKVHDCIGLIKGYMWSTSPDAVPVYNAPGSGCSDISADQAGNMCIEKGSAVNPNNIPDIIGLALNRTGHIGVYVGKDANGVRWAIHAKGKDSGIVKEEIIPGRWTTWGKLPFIDYSNSTGELPTFYSAASTNAATRTLQSVIPTNTKYNGCDTWRLTSLDAAYALAEAGIKYIGRYLWSTDNSGKGLSAEEVYWCLKAGLKIGLFYERDTKDVFSGALQASSNFDNAIYYFDKLRNEILQHQGIIDFCRGLRDLTPATILPKNATIFFAVDTDANATAKPGGALDIYFKALNKRQQERYPTDHSNCPLIGAYGGYQAMKYLLDNSLVSNVWQSYAWSYGKKLQDEINYRTSIFQDYRYGLATLKYTGSTNGSIALDMGTCNYISLISDEGIHDLWPAHLPSYTGSGHLVSLLFDTGVPVIGSDVSNQDTNKNYSYTGQIKLPEAGAFIESMLPKQSPSAYAQLALDKILQADIASNQLRAKSTNLLASTSHVESPFIMLKVGRHVFGSYMKTSTKYVDIANRIYQTYSIDYPNYMESIRIVKVNGLVNQYTIRMIYLIEAGDDPNLIDKIFSSVGYSTVKISYGDWNMPAFIYKEEEALITDLKSSIDFLHSKITYTLSCTSTAVKLLGGYYNFDPHQSIQPSTLITEMLSKTSPYKLLDIFPGMLNSALISSKGLIPTDDAPVLLEAKPGYDSLSYLNYLVSCMSPQSGSNSNGLKSASYYLTICDDITGEFGGLYFKITKISADTSTTALTSQGVYEVDIGYPTELAMVTSFKLDSEKSWDLLYKYSEDTILNTYTYNIDNNGLIVTVDSPNIMLSSKYGRVTESLRDWWTKMTLYPIKATLTMKGLLKPAMLMQYVRLNVLFYGLRHISSGLYVITKEEDTVDGTGYRTTLSLLRVAGDIDYIVSAEKNTSSEKNTSRGTAAAQKTMDELKQKGLVEPDIHTVLHRTPR